MPGIMGLRAWRLEHWKEDGPHGRKRGMQALRTAEVVASEFLARHTKILVLTLLTYAALC
jgi:hypothetical protein